MRSRNSRGSPLTRSQASSRPDASDATPRPGRQAQRHPHGARSMSARADRPQAAPARARRRRAQTPQPAPVAGRARPTPRTASPRPPSEGLDDFRRPFVRPTITGRRPRLIERSICSWCGSFAVKNRARDRPGFQNHFMRVRWACVRRHTRPTRRFIWWSAARTLRPDRQVPAGVQCCNLRTRWLRCP